MSESRQVPAWTAPYRLVVALRLLRARRINLISILGVMLGVASIIVVMSVMDGFQLELRTMIRGTLSDLIIQVDPARAGQYDPLKEALEEIDGVEAVTLQLHTFGAIPGQNRATDGGRQNYLPVRIVGLIPGHEARVSKVIEQMKGEEGQPDDPFEVALESFVPPEMPRVVISGWMARRLGGTLPLEVGDRFVLITLEQTGGEERVEYVTNDREVIVSRIYSSGNTDYDKLHLYVDSTGTGRDFFPEGQSVIAELRVRLTDYMRAAELREMVARAIAPFDPSIAAYPRWYIETWEERQRNLLRAVENEKFLLAFVLFFIVLVACFTIFATLTMTVVEKTRDIGVLLALGATPGGVMSMFVLNGTLVGAFGAVLGYGLGMLTASNVNPIRNFLRDTFGWDIFPPEIYLFDAIPTHIEHGVALWFAVGAGVAAFVFAIIPSIRAARLRPVSALRYE
ncbi:MAG: ABC transporter permease [Planctomycetota bacterium]|jgi:lipoprotein-releasing system permease protein